MTNTHNSVFYAGVTNDLTRRTYEHKNKLVSGFTKKYNIWKLIYFEEHLDIREAIIREKQIKDYRREKKFELIKLKNPAFEEIKI